MMKSIILIFTGLWSVAVLAKNHVGSDEDLAALLKLDIEELANISVASKRLETVKDAPGVVSVISAEEMQRYGYRYLRDVLDRQTSLQNIGAAAIPHDRTSIRGIAETYLDNNVLILLNGRPVRESAAGSVNHDLYNYFPVAALKQIEIIRGPGSVLYGTSAFSGVINLVTKDAPETPSAKLSLSYGSFDYKQGQLTGGGKLGDLEVFGAIQGIHSDGDSRNDVRDEFGNAGTYTTGLDGEQLVLNLKYKGLSINTLQSSTNSDAARIIFVYPNEQFDYDRQFIDVGYRHQITSKWDISANASYHHHTSRLIVDAASTVDYNKAENALFEITNYFRPIDDLNVIAGATYRILSARGDAFDADTTAFRLYSQADYQLTDWLKAIGGIQYNRPQGIPDHISPRIAFILHFDENWGAKLLYGNAFLEAPLSARFINSPGFRGNPNLKPETINTFDAQLFYNGRQGNVALTYFHSKEHNLISVVPGFPATLTNAGTHTFQGFELEGKWHIDDHWQFIGNVSFQTNKRSTGQKNASYAPKWMVKAGLSYDSSLGYQASLFNSYFSRSGIQNTGATVINPDPAGYNLLTANLTIYLGKVLTQPALSNVQLALYADNLLDEDIFFPSILHPNVNSIPHHYRRGFYGTLTINF